jgi:O-antigen/teichoic acid export membrane protein
MFSAKIFKRLWRFSSGMALTSISAAFLANVDRIALSKMVPTEELGKYAVAFTATGLIQMGIQPFYRAFFPRYSELVSSGDVKLLHEEYFRSCQLMAIVIIPLGIIGWHFAPQILYGWLGKYDQTIIDIFRWLLIGIMCSGIMWLPAAFQQAHGWTSLHASMIIGALLIGVPIMLYCINTFGVVGATAIWFIHGVIGITVGLWLMHRRLLKGALLNWYTSVLMPPLLASLFVLLISKWLYPSNNEKWVDLIWIGLTIMLGIYLSHKVVLYLKK